MIISQSSCQPATNTKSEGPFVLVKSKMDLSGISTDCKKYIRKRIRTAWKYDAEGKCYYDAEGIRVMLLDNQECLKRISSDQLISILGQANRVFDSKKDDAKILTYHLGKDCIRDYPTYWTMQFVFNGNNELVRIGMGGISNS